MNEQRMEGPIAPASPSHGLPRRSLVVSCYLLLGSLWILGSDSLLELMVPDRKAAIHLQTYKGWFFVAVTSLVLHRLLRPHGADSRGPREPPRGMGPWLAPFGISAMLILALTVSAMRQAYDRVEPHGGEDAIWVAATGTLALLASALWLFLLRERMVWKSRLSDAREQAEKLRALQLLQSISDGSTDAIYAKDLGGRFVLFNREACRALGKSAEEVIGRDDFAIFPGEQAERMRDFDRRVMDNAEPVSYEHEVQTVRGARTYLTTKAPLRNAQGQVTGVFGVSRDISVRRQMELALKRTTAELQAYRDQLEELVELRTCELEHANRELITVRDSLDHRNHALRKEVESHRRTEGALQRAMAEMEAFSYTVSHDLRAPLAAVQSFAAALAESEAAALSEQGRHRLDRIVVGAQRMNRMIDDILACSRVERAEMRCREVDLNSLVAEVVAEAKPLWPVAAVVIEPLPNVGGDVGMLRQIFANLIGNALKFSSARADARVDVTARRTQSGTEICVRDNGAGFDPAYAGKLFGMFQRLHSEAEFSGTGVGLAIVKRLVQRHGGQVRAESVPGGWTTFSFTLGDVCALPGCEPSGQVH
jgi:PAS domain S-box-containing protein